MDSTRPISFWWSEQGLSESPSIFQKSMTYKFMIYIQSFAKISQRFSNSIQNYFSSLACISILLFFCRPSYIARFVMTFVVNSVNAHLWVRAVANVFKKCLKRIQPLVADFNATATIIFKVLTFWIGASGNYLNPCIPFLSIGHPVLVIVLRSKTSARPCMSMHKAHPSYFRSVPAIAFTQEVGLPVTSW